MLTKLQSTKLRSTLTSKLPRFPKVSSRMTWIAASSPPVSGPTADTPTSLLNKLYGLYFTNGAHMPATPSTAGPLLDPLRWSCSSRVLPGSLRPSPPVNTPNMLNIRSKLVDSFLRLSRGTQLQSTSPRSSAPANYSRDSKRRRRARNNVGKTETFACSAILRYPYCSMCFVRLSSIYSHLPSSLYAVP